ncbi:CRP-like cAMP-binding protein [Pedobacter sp. AK017]|uniref:Crp/Fnr family transcriptional regulator n=1 Tax=Pedobacter sp. AK017 TaxID=2723073 RepID=UPI00161B4BEC|nr:Crp/Fnr family transcriptional regulator [Pedobacter sp. AK017]MBB5438908.1 CRP-like cAMP-binding protein [Pedobacter sp. AK017]
MKDRLKHLLLHLAGFNQTELERITELFKLKVVKRNTVLLQQGEVCNAFYYVNNGCLRTYFLDKNGMEKTRFVMTDCNIGTALTSFINQTPSAEIIEATEDTTLLAISHANFFRLNKEMDAWKSFYQKILEMAYSYQNQRIEQLVTLSAKQRYDLVLKEKPILIQKLSNRSLASYLDIREETLSRLKSK